jgi:hypothetical protein
MSVSPRRLQHQEPHLVLACEGRDDRAFLEVMVDSLQIQDRRIEEYRGKSELPRYLRGLRDSDLFDTVRAVGILRDADDSPDRAWLSVRDTLRRLSLPCPSRPGLFRAGPCGDDERTRTIGVFIVPDGQSTGALEDLCLRAVASDPALVCAQEFLDCVQVHSGVVCPNQHVPKARLNAWLASRADPTLRLGQAIASGDIAPDSVAFGPIRQFLQDLAAAAATGPATDSDDA